MKIVYVGTLAPHPGGSATHGTALLSGLARRGHRISAIAPITADTRAQLDPLAAAPFTVARYLVPCFETVPGQPSSEEFRAIEGRGVAAHLTPLLEAVRPDLIVAGRETFAWHVSEPARRYSLPWVVIAHGGTTWGLHSGTYPPDLARALVARLAEADRVVAVARHQVARLRDLGLENVAVIPNRVDTDVFAPARADPSLLSHLDIAAGDVVVAHVSNLKDIKRPFDVIRSASIALRRDPRLLYLFVGDGPNRARLAAECERLGIGDRFRFAGWVPHEQVARHLHLAHIVVMPSELEALALAYLETQACGRVLIASDIAGACEVVEDGVTGLLFEMGNVSALAEATLRAAADPALRSAIGARARACAVSRPLSAALDEYEALFAAAAQQATGASRSARG